MRNEGTVKDGDGEKKKEPIAPLNQIKVLPYKDKAEWNLETKYNIGKKQ